MRKVQLDSDLRQKLEASWPLFHPMRVDSR